MLMNKLKEGLSAKLAEFDAKSKELAEENQKFDQSKMNVFATLSSNLNFKKTITQKLD